MRDTAQLLKLRLAASVVFSAWAGYMLGIDTIDWTDMFTLIAGGMLVVGSSNAFNQLWEIRQDALMHRTRTRPLPAGRMTETRALFIAATTGTIGLILLAELNILTALFGFLSLLLYVLAYTPLKAKTPWAVFVGAFPGAIPSMLGWVAATGRFGIEPGLLFALQFVWQFPHFWSIAWFSFDDYARAGYFLLPGKEKGPVATYGIFVYVLFMVAISLLPYTGITGKLILSWPAALLALLLGFWVIAKAWSLRKNPSDSLARNMMFSTIGYLTGIQLIYVLDKLFLHEYFFG